MGGGEIDGSPVNEAFVRVGRHYHGQRAVEIIHRGGNTSMVTVMDDAGSIRALAKELLRAATELEADDE